MLPSLSHTDSPSAEESSHSKSGDREQLVSQADLSPGKTFFICVAFTYPLMSSAPRVTTESSRSGLSGIGPCLDPPCYDHQGVLSKQLLALRVTLAGESWGGHCQKA